LYPGERIQFLQMVWITSQTTSITKTRRERESITPSHAAAFHSTFQQLRNN